MINIISQNGKTSYDVKEFVIDTPQDLTSLPTNAAMGSSAIVISTGAVYMLNSSGEWIEI
jgi:hypothetical protein